MKNNRLESIITQSLERFYSRLMPILNSKQPKESGKGLTKNDLTDELKGKYDEAVNMSHGHANKAILDNTNASFTTALKGNYDDAVNKSHTHSNKTILDNTNESFTTDIKTQINTNKSNISTVADYINDSDLITDSESKMIKSVPDNANHACGISMIGGRTVKSKNLLKPQNGLKELTVNGIIFTPVFDSNGYLEYVTANGTATANASFIVTKLKEDISGYILSLSLSQESLSYGIACELGVSPWTTYQTIKGSGEKTVPSITYTDTINVYVQVLKDATANNVKFYPMLRKSGTSSVYEPYHEDLWNTPVESVVSNNKNIFDKSLLTNTTQIEDGFSITGSSTLLVYTDNFKPNTSYSISCETYNTKSGDNYRLQVVYTDGTTSRDELLNANTSWRRRTLTTPNTKTIKGIRKIFSNISGGSANYRYFQIEEGTAPTSYIKPYKTTLLIPDSDKSLPCFGYGINETVQNIRDYENNTYTQMVAEVRLGDIDKSKYSIKLSNSSIIKFGITIPTSYLIHNPSTTKVYTNLIANNCDYNGSSDATYNESESDGLYTYNGSSSTNGSTTLYYVTHDTTKTIDDVMNELANTVIVFELATPVVTDCSDMLHPIRCEAGGTITFTNEHSLDVPNTVVYKKEVSLS